MKAVIYQLLLSVYILQVLGEQTVFKLGELVDDYFQDDSYQSKIPIENVTELKLHGTVLSQQSYKKLFSQKFPKLQTLKMTSIIVNKKILGYIINAPFFQQLNELSLQDCNIDDEILSIINTQKTVNITKLKLNSNFISEKGWRSLNNFKFQNKLITLQINKNSLLSNKSFDHILNFPITSLQNISLQKTMINEQNNIRLLQTINKNLISLDLGANNYQISFFEKLSKISMENLQFLKFASINFDRECAQKLKEWKLPKLIYLDLDDNFVDDEVVALFINKKNMPNLKYLNLTANSVTGKGLQLLKNQGFKFVDLRLKSNKIVEKEFRNLIEMDLSELKVLSLTDNLITTENLKNILHQINITDKLQQLHLNGLIYVERILQILPYEKLKNIRQLGLIGHDLNSGIDQFLKQKFEKLDYLLLNGAIITEKNLIQLLSKLKDIAPKLTRLQCLTVSTLKLSTEMLKLDSIPDKCDLTFSQMHLYKESQTFYVKSLDIIGYSTIHCPSLKCLEEQNNILTSLKNLNFKRLQGISIGGPSNFHKLIVKHLQMIMDQTAQLPYLNSLAMELISTYQSAQITEIYDLINRFKFPSLSSFSLICDSQKQIQLITQQRIQTYIFNDFFNKFDKSKLTKIEDLVITTNIQKEFDLIKLIKSMTLPYLNDLTLSSCRLSEDNMLELVQDINEKGYRIRELDISGNFLQNRFDEILKSMTLRALDISAIKIGSNFHKLASISTQFLQSINIGSCFINDQDLQAFIIKKKQQLQEGFAIFPLMSSFNIGQNQFTSSFKGLLDGGIPYLTGISFPMTEYPDIFNDAFSSKCYRLQSITYSKSSLNQFNSNLNPKTARRITQLVLVDTFLSGEDIEALSKLQFPRLLQATLQLDENITCQSLKYILKIIQNTKTFVIALKLIENQHIAQLNDSCIDITQDYGIKRAYRITFVSEYNFVYLPRFVEVMLSNITVLLGMTLVNIGVNTTSLAHFTQNAIFNKLVTFVMANCNLDDQFVAKILNNYMPQLIAISFSQNKKLTYKAITPLGNKFFPLLLDLQLSRTNIGDEGIQILSSSKFFFLRALNLEYANLTSKGLEKLNDMMAPQLQALLISGNDISQQDVVDFYLKQNFPYIVVLSYQNKMSFQNYEIITETAERNQMQQFQLVAEIYYHEKPKNYAKIQALRDY